MAPEPLSDPSLAGEERREQRAGVRLAPWSPGVRGGPDGGASAPLPPSGGKRARTRSRARTQ